ncbi:hypothetical protein ORI20_13785 [Mycobacterium sp. CVI_P3]|uniref:Uncharacterized protein n=1 Tax=Mycobacterium pinniadriaticum TaxID=2994102 RepID=A0ABT3SE31_9MYCO|nr:hypothetical protein [Mycobacterium pinniadriaticum]MCX2931350.1 hypothetical protein [Mycobacterium pinniadriaticum]MCX2937774.1 hypothetical protein [Mycobacterium pinniadriaticum]
MTTHRPGCLGADCCCDGAAYTVRRHPFLIHRDCPVHSGPHGEYPDVDPRAVITGGRRDWSGVGTSQSSAGHSPFPADTAPSLIESSACAGGSGHPTSPEGEQSAGVGVAGPGAGVAAGHALEVAANVRRTRITLRRHFNFRTLGIPVPEELITEAAKDLLK